MPICEPNVHTSSVDTKLPFGTQDRFEAQGLRKSFKRREVVRGVSIHVDAGEVVGLLGPNGAGKTTIFDMMVGLCQPDAGQILLNKRVITDLPMFKRARRGIGNGSGLKSHGRWSSAHNFFCSMNPLPESIPSQSAIFNTSLHDSKTSRSAFLLPTTMCRKPSPLRSVPTSSMREAF